MACARRAGLASIRRAFSTIQPHPQQRSSALLVWPQNLDSTVLKIFQNGKSFPRSQELILTHKFFSTDNAWNENKDEDTLPELSKTDNTPEEKKWELVDAAREIYLVLENGDEDMEEALTQLGVQGSNLPLQFMTGLPIFSAAKDFEALQRVLLEISAARCNYTIKTFSFATAWHNDLDMLNEVMEMLEKLELSLRKYAYEMLIAALCQKNHANASLVVLEKMLSMDCAPRMRTYRPLIQVYCQNNQMNKVHEVFEMMKDRPQDPICYHIVLSALCNRKQFAEAVEFLRRMVNMGCKPDAIIYNILMGAAYDSGRMQSALQLFDRLKEEGITPLSGTYVRILDGLFEIRGFDGVYSILIQHSGKDSKLESSNFKHLIRVCSKSGQEQEARNLRMEMKAKGLD